MVMLIKFFTLPRIFKKLLLAFTWCWIYYWVIGFNFFGFSWNIFFFCATSSSILETICSSSVRIISVWQGELCRGSSTLNSVNSAPHLGSFVQLDMLNDQRIYIETLKLSIILCIFEHVQQKFITLFGDH